MGETCLDGDEIARENRAAQFWPLSTSAGRIGMR